MVRQADKIVLLPADVRRFRHKAGARARWKAREAAEREKTALAEEALEQVIDLVGKGLARRRATKARRGRIARVRSLRKSPSKTFLEIESKGRAQRLTETRRRIEKKRREKK